MSVSIEKVVGSELCKGCLSYVGWASWDPVINLNCQVLLCNQQDSNMKGRSMAGGQKALIAPQIRPDIKNTCGIPAIEINDQEAEEFAIYKRFAFWQLTTHLKASQNIVSFLEIPFNSYDPGLDFLSLNST